MWEECLLREGQRPRGFHIRSRFRLRQIDAAVQRHTNLRALLGTATQYADRLAVRQQDIFCQRRQLCHHLGGLCLHQAFKRRVHPGKIAISDKGCRLVDGKPIAHPVRQGVRKHANIVCKIIADFLAVPAALFVRPHRQIPVEYRNHRLNPGSLQLIHQLAVKFQPLGVYRVRPRHYPRPADRKPIGLDPQLFQQGYILFIAVIMVTGNIAVFAVLYVAAAQGVPDAGYLSILVIGTLNLVSGTGRTPKEIFRKTHCCLLFV